MFDLWSAQTASAEFTPVNSILSLFLSLFLCLSVSPFIRKANIRLYIRLYNNVSRWDGITDYGTTSTSSEACKQGSLATSTSMVDDGCVVVWTNVFFLHSDDDPKTLLLILEAAVGIGRFIVTTPPPPSRIRVLIIRI